MAEKKQSPKTSVSDSHEAAVSPGTTEVERMTDNKQVDADKVHEPAAEDESEAVAEEEHAEENDEQAASESSDTENVAPVKKKKKRHGALEYDLKHMYPEMNVLTEKNKNEWNYEDPKTIRALWLEVHTNALSEWKIKYAKIKRTSKPLIEVRETASQNLRKEHKKNESDKIKEAEDKLSRMIERGRESPRFGQVKLPTNTATDLRYRYNRNNPPIPLYYLQHFDKHKKPPFKVHGIGNQGCRTYRAGV